MKTLKSLKILLFCMMMAGCAGLNQPGDPYEESPYNQSPYHEEERMNQPFSGDVRKELGRQFLMAAAKEFTFVNDPDIVSLVNEVGSRIVRAAGKDPAYYHFFVIRKNQINAFAVPGGYIFVYDGLLKNMKSVDELAGVLAHEIAHIERDHYFKDSNKTTLADFAQLAAIIAGIAAGRPDAAVAISSGANISYKLKLSREHETEADVAALRYLGSTNYHPSGLASFFRTLSLYERLNSGDALPPYLSTHPGIGDRQGILQSITRDVPAKKGDNHSGRWEWDRIMTILRAADRDDMPDLSGHDEDKKHYLKGLYAYKSFNFKAAISEYNEAIRINPAHAVYHADLAMLYMQMQHYDKAREEALKSTAISETNPAPFVALGMAAKHDLNYKDAVSYFSKAAALNCYDPFIRYHLAGSFYAMNMSSKGRYHLGHFYRLNLSPERAVMQLHMALKDSLKENMDEEFSAAVKEEIDRIMREGI